jgi:hypothetical protein
MINRRIQELKTIANRLLDPIKPRYSELTTYQAAVTFILLVMVYPEILPGFYSLIMKDMENSASVFPLLAIPFSLIMLGGIILSIWHVFVNCKKSKGEKFLMGAFAVFISGLAGLLATIELLPDQWSLLLIFPLWNYLWGILLIDRLAAPQEAITDEEASREDVITVTAVVILTFAVVHSIMGYSWPVVFSICMSISSLVLLLRKLIYSLATKP